MYPFLGVLKHMKGSEVQFPFRQHLLGCHRLCGGIGVREAVTGSHVYIEPLLIELLI